MFTEKVNKFSDKLNKAPVTVDAPREETRPAWQAAAFASGYRKQVFVLEAFLQDTALAARFLFAPRVITRSKPLPI